MKLFYKTTCFVFGHQHPGPTYLVPPSWQCFRCGYIDEKMRDEVIKSVMSWHKWDCENNKERFPGDIGLD